jgi:HAD superfamily hydrolase (TIGR01549 family)
MDGTLYDSAIDWLALRREIGLEYDGRPILAQLEEADADVRDRGREILLRTERDSAQRGDLLPGARELIATLRDHDVRCVLITNNSRLSADVILARHPLDLDLVLTRDDGAAKPSPEIFIDALRRFDAEPAAAIAIGDTHLDVIAAHRAGIGEIIAVAMPEWMSKHIPAGVFYREVSDLQEARALLEELIA